MGFAIVFWVWALLLLFLLIAHLWRKASEWAEKEIRLRKAKDECNQLMRCIRISQKLPAS